MERRTFLKEMGLVSAGLAATTMLPKTPNVAPRRKRIKGKNADKPNILVILVDQLRFPQGSFDQTLMDTAAPRLASFRQQSVSFGLHYAAATACSPSRSTLITGLYTHQNGMFLTNVNGLAGAGETPDLNPGFPTYGSILNSDDFEYDTYWWGKWHLSADDQTTCDYTSYGFTGRLPCPSPNGGPAQGLGLDPQTTAVFKNWLNASAEYGPWCTTVSLVNPHDVQWFPKYSKNEPGEDNPPEIQEFHTGLVSNFEHWPQALFDEGKPALQQAWVVLSDSVFGPMPTNPGGSGYPDLWFQLLDLYYLVTSYVDKQIDAILSALEDSFVADNTIVIITSDHGEYGGAHGLHGKGFALYEEAIHVPLYVRDPTGNFVPPTQVGSVRNELTSHVDIAPLLMTIAGGNAWRSNPKYAHLADRADLVDMLSDPTAKGRDYILHTSDEDIPEEAPKLGIPYKDVLARNVLPPAPLPQRPPPTHAIGYRTNTSKLGVYSYFESGSVAISTTGQEAELYDYSTDGIEEVINNAPSGSKPNQTLYDAQYDALFNPTTGAIVNELRKPLPTYLQSVQQAAFTAYTAYEARVDATSFQYVPLVEK